MFQEAVGFVKHKVSLSMGSYVAQGVAYLAAFIAAVFGLCALFVWLARTESLVFACLVFAGSFLALAIIALIVMKVMGGRARRVRPPQAAIARSLLNPTIALGGFRLLRTLRKAPLLSVGTALAAGLALSVMGRRDA
jgi:hypothetical protein